MVPAKRHIHLTPLTVFFIFVSFFLPALLYAAEGDVKVHVGTDTGTALASLQVYGFTAAGSYTGKKATTDQNGIAPFDSANFPSGNYKFRIDYLGYQFWSDAAPVQAGTELSVGLPHKNIAVTVQGISQGAAEPLPGIKGLGQNKLCQNCAGFPLVFEERKQAHSSAM